VLTNSSGVPTSRATTSALHGCRKGAKTPLVATDVRRSIKLEGKSKGFKVDGNHPKKDCFCCSVDPPPPTLSGEVIRSLGADFCKISSVKLGDEVLQKKPLAKKSDGVVPIGHGQKKIGKPNVDKTSKKTRKE
jgi:hypothetical protein